MKNSNTKSNFIMAFWKLYEKKYLEKISIRELCELAGYNRTTFYAHFKDIYDLFDTAVDELIKPSRKIIMNIEDLPSILKSPEIIYIFLNFFKKNNHYIEMIIVRNNEYIFFKKVKEIIFTVVKNKTSKEYVDYIIEYQVSAISGVIVSWIKNGRKLSEQELVQLLYKISINGVYNALYTDL